MGHTCSPSHSEHRRHPPVRSARRHQHRPRYHHVSRVRAPEAVARGPEQMALTVDMLLRQAREDALAKGNAPPLRNTEPFLDNAPLQRITNSLPELGGRSAVHVNRAALRNGKITIQGEGGFNVSAGKGHGVRAELDLLKKKNAEKKVFAQIGGKGAGSPPQQGGLPGSSSMRSQTASHQTMMIGYEWKF